MWRRIYSRLYPDWEERRGRALLLLAEGKSVRDVMKLSGLSQYMVRSLAAQGQGVLLRQNQRAHHGADAATEGRRDMSWAEINRRLSKTVRRLEEH